MSDQSNSGLVDGLKVLAIFVAVMVVGHTLSGRLDKLAFEFGNIIISATYLGFFGYVCVVINRILFNRKCYQSAVAKNSMVFTRVNIWTGERGASCCYDRPLTESEQSFYDMYNK